MIDGIKEFLTALHSALDDNEGYRLDLTRKGESMDIVLIPVLRGKSDVPEEAKQIRAALAMPLAMRDMTLDALSEEFSNRMRGYGSARNTASEAYDELLATLNDATATAKNTKSRKATKGKKKEAAKIVNKDDGDSCIAESDTPGKTKETSSDSGNSAQANAGGVLNF